MAGPSPRPIVLSKTQRCILEGLVRRRHCLQAIALRARVILAAAAGLDNSQIAQRLGCHRELARRWRRRFAEAQPAWEANGGDWEESVWTEKIAELLEDRERSGAPAKFTAEQLCQIVALACAKRPEECGRPVTHWTARELADEATQRGIVVSISPRHVGRFLKDGGPAAASGAVLDQQPGPGGESAGVCATVGGAYAAAPALAAQGVHTIRVDEKTDIQAIERDAPALPRRPGLVEKQELNYDRHGTLCMTANLDVASGKIVTPTLGPTRGEADFASPIAPTVATDPAGTWLVICDQLNTHMSQTLVCLVAMWCGLVVDLGVKGKSGILKSRPTRRAFLEDPTHGIGFLYTPRHASWMNQIEIWFAILSRRALKRGSFASLEELHERLLAFVDYFNRTMAKPFRWTYKGRPLTL